MAYSYPERNRPQGMALEVHRKTFAANTVGAGTNVENTIDLPHNGWQLNGLIWAEGTDAAVSIKVYPWIDRAQTLAGNALSLVELGGSAAVTALSVAAAGTIDGYAFSVLACTNVSDRTLSAHGFKVSISATTTPTTGNVSYEFVCIPDV